MCPVRTNAGQVFRDMVDTCAGSRRSGLPESSGRKRMARQASLRVGRKATGWPRTALGSRGWRLWKDIRPLPWIFRTCLAVMACGPGCVQPGTRPCGPPALAAESARTLPMRPVWTLGERWDEGCPRTHAGHDAARARVNLLV